MPMISSYGASMIAHEGPVYARLLRGKVPSVLKKHKPDYRFQLGKAQMIREGRDVLVISTGLMTMRALDAAVKLAEDKIDVACCIAPRSSRSIWRPLPQKLPRADDWS